MRRPNAPLAALALAAALAVPGLAGGAPARKTPDIIRLAPDYADYGVRTIALLPIVTYDNSVEARRQVETVAAQVLRGTSYKWLSASLVRELLLREGGDSLIQAVSQGVLKTGRTDSLAAPRLSRTTHARALFSVRVDQFERLELPYDQAGKPSTTVRLSAALVDSTGRLLWTASGSLTAEGPYQDPTSSAVGMSVSGLQTKPLTNQGGAPTYAEALNRLLSRWLPQFPPAPAAAN